MEWTKGLGVLLRDPAALKEFQLSPKISEDEAIDIFNKTFSGADGQQVLGTLRAGRAPAGVDAASWQKVMAIRPTMKQPPSPGDWGKAINKLRDEPTEKRIQQFDHRFAQGGGKLGGAAILKMLDEVAPSSSSSAPWWHVLPPTLLPPNLRPDAGPLSHREPESGDLTYRGVVPVKGD